MNSGKIGVNRGGIQGGPGTHPAMPGYTSTEVAAGLQLAE